MEKYFIVNMVDKIILILLVLLCITQAILLIEFKVVSPAKKEKTKNMIFVNGVLLFVFTALLFFTKKIMPIIFVTWGDEAGVLSGIVAFMIIAGLNILLTKTKYWKGAEL